MIYDNGEFIKNYRSPCGCACQKETKGVLDRIAALEASNDQRDLRESDFESRLSWIEKEKALGKTQG